MAEVYSTLTRLPPPHRATPDQALEFLESIDLRFRQVSLEAVEYMASIREAVVNRVSGGAIYDALIAKCALKAGADRIVTWNLRHYRLLGADVASRIVTPDPG
jgi:predicted nucleic acid-binding protein